MVNRLIYRDGDHHLTMVETHIVQCEMRITRQR